MYDIIEMDDVMGGRFMENKTFAIKDYIRNELPVEIQSVALNFITFLQENNITFYKDNSDCWKDKIYYWCKSQ